MADQQTNSTLSTNGGVRASLKGRKRQWKDLSIDPLSEGLDEHTAAYIVGRTPVTWDYLTPGTLFSRTKLGKAIHVKLDASKAVCLDTGESLEIAPKYRAVLQVYKVTSFNSVTGG